MGGWGSGRSGGRPTAELSRRINIGWMVRTKRVVPGECVRGTLSWTCGDEPAGSISYEADMRDPDNAELRLTYRQGSGANREEVCQVVPLVYTVPHYGGRRWWMICPFRRNRVGMLYMPGGGDRFAGRKAWRLAYNIQRVPSRDRPFEALFRLQRKLGCEQGYGSIIRRPRGMWHRTFDRHWERFLDLEDKCSHEILALVNLPGGSGAQGKMS